MQTSILQGSSMNASQLLGYAITNETGDWLFTFELLQKMGTFRTYLFYIASFSSVFSGENIIRSYSKSLASNQDSKIWWCYSPHWLSVNIHHYILKSALKCVLGRSKKSLHLAQCLPYMLTVWGATSHSLTSHS